ncbi:MAG: S1 RNA-binding domain-containing protein [Mangrovibacterium sp.]
MIALGTINELEVVKKVDFGVYLDGGQAGEILMPSRYVPEDCEIGQMVEVFIYLDGEERPVATTEQPYAQVGDFAFLEVMEVTEFGAFLDWGIMKQLFVPFREQQVRMEVGKRYVVFIYVDDQTNRLTASSKLDKFVDNLPVDYELGEEVSLLIVGKTDLGYKAIIDNSHWGLIFNSEVHRRIRIGDKTTGFIKNIRDDEKIDLSLTKQGYVKVEGIAGEILDKLRAAGGFLPVHDKSSPELIAETFGISKKNFKMAVGSLYKERLISIEAEGIRELRIEN